MIPTPWHLGKCRAVARIKGSGFRGEEGMNRLTLEDFHCCLVAHSCPALCNPVACCAAGLSVRGLSQARILECVTISYSRGSSWPRHGTRVSCITGGFFTNRAIFCVNNLLYVITLKCFKWYVKLYLISEAKFCFKNSLTMLIAISSGEGSFSTLNLIKKTKNYNDSRMFCLIWLCCQFTRIIQKNL